MSLILSIENADRLSDGGPLRVEVAGRGIDIGRDQHLDWTLPDPDRVVSGKHCEVRFRDGGYWLTDVSTNGTFLNGNGFRLDAPHRLRNGDKLAIGHYIIAVQVIEQAGAGGGAPPPSAAAPAPAWNDTGNPWGVSGEAPPPADRRDFMPPPDRGPRPPDFLDWAVSVETPSMPAPAPYAPPPYAPPPYAPPPYAPPPQAAPPADWGAPSFADSEPQVPTPRRPAPAWEAPPAPPPAPPSAAPTPPAWEEPSPVAPEQPAWEAPPPPPAARVQPEPPDTPMLPPEPASSAAVASDTLARIARAAGIPADVVASRRPDELADEIGTALRLTAHHLAQMLASRAETKSLVRSANRTMIQALDNNPLKFSPTPEDALKIMFGAPSRSYMRAVPAIEESFRDLKTHQVQTYSAIQGALEALYEDLSPTTIDKSVDQDKGIGAMLSSRKAKLWDVYTERWKAKTGRSDGRLVDAFMLLFAECYDRLKGKG